MSFKHKPRYDYIREELVPYLNKLPRFFLMYVSYIVRDIYTGYMTVEGNKKSGPYVMFSRYTSSDDGLGLITTIALRNIHGVDLFVFRSCDGPDSTRLRRISV